MTTSAPSGRRGHTLAELIIAMTVFSIVGASIVRLISVQSRAFGQQDAARAARAVSRAAVNLLTSELRMVELTGGIAAASGSSITVRVPYAMGVVCNANTVSLLPVDSLAYAQAGFSGYAWQDTLGNYTYVESGVSVASGATANCTPASVTTLTGGRVAAVSPALPAEALPGNPVMLFQRITYAFAASGLLPGRLGLFRTPAAGGVAEEIAAPFDAASAKFRFFVNNASSAQDAPPASLPTITGLELVLTGASRTTPRGRSAPVTAPFTTAVFFQNRAN